MDEKPWLKHYDPGVPQSLSYPAQPLFEFFEASARKFPERACTIFQGATLSFREMKELTDRLASGLAGRGLRKGDRVGIFMPNLPQFVLAFYAALKAGGVLVAINPQYKAREIEQEVNDAGVKLLFTTVEAYELVRSIRANTSIQSIVVSDPSEDLAFPGTHPPGIVLEENDAWLSDLIREGSAAGSLNVAVGPQDAAILQYTGGTTGTPKGAIGLHRNLVANTLQVRSWLVNAVEGEETVLMAIPMYHVYGMVLGMSLGMALGASLLLIPNPRDQTTLFESIQRYRPTIFPAVPTLLNSINRHPDVLAGKYSLRSLKVCISGSAPLTRETKETFEALSGSRVCEGYGLSEAPTATHCNPVLGGNRTGSIGLPWPDVESRIVSLLDGETPVPPGEIGELALRGPQVMKAYHNMPEETRHVLRNGWLYTGDIARMDEDGYFYIVDRKKDLIKVSGFQVWPREVEQVLEAHPAVAEVGAGGIPDAFKGEVVKAWVVLKAGASASEGELIAWCRHSLAGFKVPKQIEFRRELPRTTVGKVLRRELVRQHLASIDGED